MIDKVLELESKMLTDEYRSNIDFLKSTLSNDFTELGTSGRLYTKFDVLNSKSLNSSSIKIRDLKCRNITDCSFLVTYTAFKDEVRTFRSSIWRIEEEELKLFFHQSLLL
jgi:ribonuclease HI